MARSLFGAALLAAIPAYAHEAAEAESETRVASVTSDVDRVYALYDDPAAFLAASGWTPNIVRD